MVEDKRRGGGVEEERVGELGRREPMCGRGRSLHGGRAVPAFALRVCGAVPGPGSAGGCPRARCRRALRRFFARGPPALTHALLFCPCAGPACAERRRQTFVPSCAFSGPGPAPPSCLEPLNFCERSRASPPGLSGLVHPSAQRPRRLPAGPGRPLPARLRGPRGVPAGTAVTPNYVDNVSARVAPWCDCGASGNLREDCEAFRGLFTRNRCLDGAIQAFASGWPPVLLDQLNPQGDPEHSLLQVSSTGRALERRSLLSILPVLALPALL
ncbi:GFRA4 isoform 3 [Pan troglodytes]|uniref:GFRA4 isoform 3 n=1 Tax=Pan troglodytes TaxID=9598 RepID=A0A2J8MSB2_PANTR|nr:GFRA4 isoform 3 [Pan troglodytes]